MNTPNPTSPEVVSLALALAAEWKTLDRDVAEWKAETSKRLVRGSIWPKPPANLARRLSAWRKSAKVVGGYEDKSRPVDGMLLWSVRRAAGLAA